MRLAARDIAWDGLRYSLAVALSPATRRMGILAASRIGWMHSPGILLVTSFPRRVVAHRFIKIHFGFRYFTSYAIYYDAKLFFAQIPPHVSTEQNYYCDDTFPQAAMGEAFIRSHDIGYGRVADIFMLLMPSFREMTARSASLRALTVAGFPGEDLRADTVMQRFGAMTWRSHGCDAARAPSFLICQFILAKSQRVHIDII